MATVGRSGIARLAAVLLPFCVLGGGVIVGLGTGNWRWAVSGIVVGIALPLVVFGLYVRFGGAARIAWPALVIALASATGVPLAMLLWPLTGNRSWPAAAVLGPVCFVLIVNPFWDTARARLLALAVLGFGLGAWTALLTGDRIWMAVAMLCPVVTLGAALGMVLARSVGRTARRAARCGTDPTARPMTLPAWLVLRALLVQTARPPDTRGLARLVSLTDNAVLPVLAAAGARGWVASVGHDGAPDRRHGYRLTERAAARVRSEVDRVDRPWELVCPIRGRARVRARAHDLTVAAALAAALDDARLLADELAAGFAEPAG